MIVSDAMPRIFDNIEQNLLPALRETLAISERADFCVGYFNLRGWRQIDSYIEKWAGGEEHCCRVLIGMQKLPEEELKEALSFETDLNVIDNPTVVRLKKQMAIEFRNQLVIGSPTNEDEEALRHLAHQIRNQKVVVKLFLRHPLHAKLYLLYRQDPVNPIIPYLGSSNLTMAGLVKQGELNVDVIDYDAGNKLMKWFNDRWNDKWCFDISEELSKIILEESWAREITPPPYHIYLKMAYHLAQEARTGLHEFKLPPEFKDVLMDFQSAAVKIAAHHLNKRNGVLIGDVVGLGKTLMATAVAKIFEDDFNLETLIICPKNLVTMWEQHAHKYHLSGKVLSISHVLNKLAQLPRYRIIILDESHNLRNKEGRRYHAIKDYIERNDSKCILLSATPYNKSYLDLSAQLGLFVDEDQDLGLKPERLLAEMGDQVFQQKYQAPLRSLAAFERSTYAEDWRELMRLYLVRRTRSFIKDNYASKDQDDREYLSYGDGKRFYFPKRIPEKIEFMLDEKSPRDQYAQLYSDAVVDDINSLALPRYGLGNYILKDADKQATPDEKRQLDNLSKAGKRLMGFCRTNLFKRLESSGQIFLLSIDRHIMRNFAYLHALETNLPIPIGIQDVELMDTSNNDADMDDIDARSVTMDFEADEDNSESSSQQYRNRSYDESWYRQQAKLIYESYAGRKRGRFRWISCKFFNKDLQKNLLGDAQMLIGILRRYGDWDAALDSKLDALHKLISKKHPKEKVLIFTQFADTVRYLLSQLKEKNVTHIEGVTGDSSDPTTIAQRFSPLSNEIKLDAAEELRILISTDVLSEGQNLQDCSIVVNYDLPWALIRLTQRIGRVDRIGQKATEIPCYYYLPVDGLEKIIRLRTKIATRIRENQEVIGSDEHFFEDDIGHGGLADLYTEKSGILEKDADTEVDLSSYAFQIWHNATKDNPALRRTIENLPNVVYSTKAHSDIIRGPEGVLVYVETVEGNDALIWLNKNSKPVTQSQLAILKAAECNPDTPTIPRHETHHELVKAGVQYIATQISRVGGQLGKPSGARYKTYNRLENYFKESQREQPLMASDALRRAIDDIYRYPLRQSAIDTLNRQLKAGINDDDLAQLVISLREKNQLSIVEEEVEIQEPRIICSMGIFNRGE